MYSRPLPLGLLKTDIGRLAGTCHLSHIKAARRLEKLSWARSSGKVTAAPELFTAGCSRPGVITSYMAVKEGEYEKSHRASAAVRARAASGTIHRRLRKPAFYGLVGSRPRASAAAGKRPRKEAAFAVLTSPGRRPAPRRRQGPARLQAPGRRPLPPTAPAPAPSSRRGATAVPRASPLRRSRRRP